MEKIPSLNFKKQKIILYSDYLSAKLVIPFVIVEFEVSRGLNPKTIWHVYNIFKWVLNPNHLNSFKRKSRAWSPRKNLKPWLWKRSRWWLDFTKWKKSSNLRKPSLSKKRSPRKVSREANQRKPILNDFNCLCTNIFDWIWKAFDFSKVLSKGK